MSLNIKNLSVNLKEKHTSILHGFSLEVKPGEVNFLLGPNGAGKSTVGKVLMAHPDYEITNGKIYLDGQDVTNLDTTEKSLAGIFLAHQYPYELNGVGLFKFLRLAYNQKLPEAEQLSVFAFKKLVKKYMEIVGLPYIFMERYLNVGFSGGEKKKTEILQLLLLKPKYAILDETDSGLDIDSIKQIFKSIKISMKENPQMSVIVISHNPNILDLLLPNNVYIMKSGEIVNAGGSDIINILKEKGYGYFGN